MQDSYCHDETGYTDAMHVAWVVCLIPILQGFCDENVMKYIKTTIYSRLLFYEKRAAAK